MEADGVHDFPTDSNPNSGKFELRNQTEKREHDPTSLSKMVQRTPGKLSESDGVNDPHLSWNQTIEIIDYQINRRNGNTIKIQILGENRFLNMQDEYISG